MITLALDYYVLIDIDKACFCWIVCVSIERPINPLRAFSKVLSFSRYELCMALQNGVERL